MYDRPRILRDPISNNRLDYDKRTNKEIVVPSLIDGTIDDVKIGKHIAIECEVDGVIRAGYGLEHFVFLKNAKVPTWIMDNHNHAFAFWHKALFDGHIKPGAILVHIDQHSDLATPMQNQKSGNNPPLIRGTRNALNLSAVASAKVDGISERGFGDTENSGGIRKSPNDKRSTINDQLVGVEEYANTVLTIADFIQPAMASGLIEEVLVVSGEVRNSGRLFHLQKENPNDKIQMTNKGQSPNDNCLKIENFEPFDGRLKIEDGRFIIVDLDLDYFAQGFDEKICIDTVKYWLAKADIVTIATSPLFIDQVQALQILHKIF